MNIKWKYIKGTNNEYIITDNGEAYSYKQGKLHKLSQSLCSKSKYSQGYYKFTISLNNIHNTVMTHQMVAKHFVKGYFNGAVINHKDGNTLNNNYHNLEWITQKNNLLDANKRNGQTFIKWCYQWQIIHPNGMKSPILNGQLEIKKYIQNNNLNCKYSMISKHKHNKGFKLIRIK